jgi:hypothetical protein
LGHNFMRCMSWQLVWRSRSFGFDVVLVLEYKILDDHWKN